MRFLWFFVYVQHPQPFQVPLELLSSFVMRYSDSSSDLPILSFFFILCFHPHFTGEASAAKEGPSPPSECLAFFSPHLDHPSLETLQCSRGFCTQIPHSHRMPSPGAGISLSLFGPHFSLSRAPPQQANYSTLIHGCQALALGSNFRFKAVFKVPNIGLWQLLLGRVSVYGGQLLQSLGSEDGV